MHRPVAIELSQTNSHSRSRRAHRGIAGCARRAAGAVRRVLAKRTAALPDPDLAVLALGLRRRPTAADLWGAWAISEVEAGLALAAWEAARGSQRRRAYRAYRDALAREAWLAGLLAHATAAARR